MAWPKATGHTAHQRQEEITRLYRDGTSHLPVRLAMLRDPYWCHMAQGNVQHNTGAHSANAWHFINICLQEAEKEAMWPVEDEWHHYYFGPPLAKPKQTPRCETCGKLLAEDT